MRYAVTWDLATLDLETAKTDPMALQFVRVSGVVPTGWGVSLARYIGPGGGRIRCIFVLII